jgi:ankyrin repeat protein
LRTAVLALALALTILAVVSAPTTAAAQDSDPALSGFVRAEPARARTAPVDALEWQRRLRPAGETVPALWRQLDVDLLAAARAGQDTRVREAIERGADLDRIGQDGFTPLGAAAWAGHRSTVRLLLRAGADPLHWGATGQGPLHLASLAGQLDVIEELLRAKVDIETLNRLRESALDVAASASQQDAMGRLIDAGADLGGAGAR